MNIADTRIRKNTEVPRLKFDDPKRQNNDVPLVPFFVSNFTQKSILQVGGQLKLYKLSVFDTVWAKKQKSWCSGVSQILHCAQLNLHFCVNFKLFGSKTSAKVSQRLETLLQKNYITYTHVCDLHKLK